MHYIYVYTDAKPGTNPFDFTELKVGQTKRLPELRVKEQDQTGNKYPLILLKYWSVPDSIQDTDLHKLFKKWNVKKTRPDKEKNEWFQINSLDTVSEAINQLQYGVARPNAFEMRAEQRECHNKVIKHFRNGGEKFLINAKMRYGKTFVCYQIVKSLEAKRVLVITYKPAVNDSWREDLLSHVDFDGWDYVSASSHNSQNPIDLDNGLYDSNVQILFTSFQDFNDFDKKKWKYAKNYHYDLVIVDEMHFGSKTERATLSLNQLEYDNILYISGTPLKALMSGEFLDEEIYTWTYADEQAKRREEEVSGWKTEIYRWLPPMEFHTFNVCDEAKKIVKHYSDEEGFTMTKLFGTNDKGKFIDESSVSEFINQIFGKNVRKNNSPIKTFNADHMLWVLPSCVKSVNAMSKLLERMVGFDYKIINVAGDNIKELDKVKNIISFYDRTITLTCGRFNTGVTVPEWDMILMLEDGKAPETYYQTVFRCQSPDKKRGKDRCVVVDFNPQRLLELVYRYSEVISTDDKDTESSLREMLEFAPILEHSGNSIKNVNVNDVFSLISDTGGYVDSFGSSYMFDWSHLNDFESYFEDISADKSSKVNKVINDNNLTKGKNFKSLTKKDSSNKDKSDKLLREKVITAMKNIPNYLFVENVPIKCVNDIFKVNDPSTFEDMVKISFDGFKKMCYDGFINTNRLNRCIMSYNQLEKML